MDKKFIEKALIELREDDVRRNQSLEQLRAWISKTPFLSEVRQGKVCCSDVVESKFMVKASLIENFLKFGIAKVSCLKLNRIYI